MSGDYSLSDFQMQQQPEQGPQVNQVGETGATKELSSVAYKQTPLAHSHVSVKTSKHERLLDAISTIFTSHQNPFETPRQEQGESGHPVLRSIQVSKKIVDQNGLLLGESAIDPIHFNWYLNQAILLSGKKNADLPTQLQLDLMVLQAFHKSSTVSQYSANNLGIQVSPFMPAEARYHRMTLNALLDSVRRSYAEAMSMNIDEIHLIYSPTFKDVLARVDDAPDVDLDIDSVEMFDKLIDTLLNEENITRRRTTVDISKLLGANQEINPEKTKEIVQDLQKHLIGKIKTLINSNNFNEDKIIDLLRRFSIVGFTQFKGQNILYTPRLFTMDLYKEPLHVRNVLGTIKNNHDRYHFPNKQGIDHFESYMSNTGYRMSPDQAKEAWLKVKTAAEILAETNVQVVEPSEKFSYIPETCTTFSQLLTTECARMFNSLSTTENGPPYLKILPEATMRLLNGLEHFRIDEKFNEKNIQNLLQISYARIYGAMKEAILQKENLIPFLNQIELIHQEMQNIIAIVKPYGEDALAHAVLNKLTSGENPIVSKDLAEVNPKVHIMPSAMYGLSNVLSSIEEQKGSTNLNVVMLKDCYFESAGTLKSAQKYNWTQLNGDFFTKSGCDQFDSDFIKETTGPVDLYVCEFRHNISMTRTEYQIEHVAEQIIKMYEKGMFAERFTVLLDTTVDLEQSEDLRKLLDNPIIKSLILKGKLNIVLLRSGQKFDMLGMDNYYGGIITSINQEGTFAKFNARMANKDDQLKGLSYQGMAHLQTYANDSLDKYRKEVMSNTQKLYQKLPTQCKENANNPMRVALIKDPKTVFIDIDFPKHDMAGGLFGAALATFIRDNKIPGTHRAGFGFANTNFVHIEKGKFRLNPGLDDEKTLDKYVLFFEKMQGAIDTAIAAVGIKDNKVLDSELDENISKEFNIETLNFE